MAVFTSVSIEDLSPWLNQFQVGKPINLRGISSGIENSNFFLTTESGEYVLTLFENLTKTQLPFYLHLMAHLAQRNIPVPCPIPNYHGNILHTLHDKPAALVSKLNGESQMTPQIPHCKEIGTMMAKLHLAAKDFPMQQANLRSLPWWKETAPIVLPFLSDNNAQLLREEMIFQEKFFTSSVYQNLPRGPIHADLFRNNAMFQNTQLSGIFDFYFAGYDTWLFDIAVTVNDWCIDQISGKLDPLLTQSLLEAYQNVRPFTRSEQNAWQSSLRGAALRFWLSRLYDYHLPRPAQMLTPHDPSHFEQILRLRISQLPNII